ncbi:MAG TPA: PQQ-dependent sugar dehydrogenase [Burkholderiaceae bacterium]|nr:PQQ-dependent sugar dehydrogenase [Burkholderiaceae bacterium]
MLRTFVASLTLAGALVAHASEPAKSSGAAPRVVTVTQGLDQPWGLAFLPDGRMLVTERPGRLRVIGADGRLDPVPVAGLPRIDAHNQGGLLDVVLHPDFAKNGWVYFSYVQKGEGGWGTELARGRLAGGPGAWRLDEVQTLFRMAPKSASGLHFGSRLVFDRAGLLYLTLGDRGEMARAQRPDDHAGKILRLTDTGQPAPGNPRFADAATRPEVYSLGHRNVQGAALHPVSGALWASEHGPQGGDELNLIQPGVNYGWPVITYGVNYVSGTKIGEGTAKAGLAQPVKHWTPSPALSGMAFYTGDKFPQWKGDLFMGALRGQSLIRVRLDGERVVEEEFILAGQLPRVRDVRMGPDGYLYLLTGRPDGALLRLEPAR